MVPAMAKIATRTRYVACCYTNRGGCVRRRRLDACGHLHVKKDAAEKCCTKMYKERPSRGRMWETETIVWFLFPPGRKKRRKK